MAGRRILVIPLVFPLAVALAWLGPARADAAGGWSWPVVGPVIHGFDPPATPYGTGHRGIDIATAVGTPVRSPAPGVVTFAGPVAGGLFVSVDHGGGLVSTCSWVSVLLVHKGDLVGEGAVLALSGAGHAGVLPAHLHFGVKRDGLYVDPLSVLAPASLVGLIRLVPVPPGGA
jgi:murein DD-endopeptidase MepM/ murein hydrolase activator NlpD